MLSSIKNHNVLVVSSVDKGISFFSELLGTGQDEPVSVAHSGGEARRMMNTDSYTLVVVDTPLSDEFGLELAIYIAENSNAGTMLIVKNEIYDEICYRVEDYGIMTISKPISKQLFHQAHRMLNAVRAGMRKLEEENRKLQVKIEDIRMIDRAKYVLMEFLKMNEAQAHRYIEKQAMDMRMTKRAVAESILKTYVN